MALQRITVGSGGERHAYPLGYACLSPLDPQKKGSTTCSPRCLIKLVVNKKDSENFPNKYDNSKQYK